MELGAVPVKPKAEFWFARRFPIGDARQAYAPVHWKGWLAILGFVAVLGGAGAFFAWEALVEQNFAQGLMVFIVAVTAATAWLQLVVRANSDTLHTTADYREGKPRV
jgi:hypothetical protein